MDRNIDGLNARAAELLKEGDDLMQGGQALRAEVCYQEALDLRQSVFSDFAFGTILPLGECMVKLSDAALARGDRQVAMDRIKEGAAMLDCDAECTGEVSTHRKAADAYMKQGDLEQGALETFEAFKQALEHLDAIPENDWNQEDVNDRIGLLGQLCIFALSVGDAEAYHYHFHELQRMRAFL